MAGYNDSPQQGRIFNFAKMDKMPTGRPNKSLFPQNMSETDRFAVAEGIRKYRASSYFEDEICFDPQSDLQKFYDDCEKDPGHKGFKSCEAFNLEDIPESYRSEDLLTMIKTLFILTVQVIVKGFSPNRTDNANFGMQELYKILGSGAQIVRFGSGKINKVAKMTGELCPCTICHQSNTLKTSWYIIEIVTARHVVYDQKEACNTVCKFGYVSYSSQVHEFSCIGAKVSPTSDWCKLKCVTHDASLAEKIQEKLTCYHEYTKFIYDVYRTAKKLPKLALIISHPHGCYKQISVGYYRRRHETGGLDMKYTYTTATCKGSSGAHVYILGRDGKLGLFPHIHCGWDPVSPLKDNFSCPVIDL